MRNQAASAEVLVGRSSTLPASPSLYVLNAAALSKPGATEHLAADLSSYNVDVTVITETHFKAKHARTASLASTAIRCFGETEWAGVVEAWPCMYGLASSHPFGCTQLTTVHTSSNGYRSVTRLSQHCITQRRRPTARMTC